MSDPAKKVEWYEVRALDGESVLIMVSEGPDGACTAVPCEVSLVRSSLHASGSSADAAMRKLEAALAGKTRHEIFGGTS